MSFEGFYQGSVLLVPNVDFGICVLLLVRRRYHSSATALTFATADDQILVRATKRTPNDKFRLPLPQESPYKIRSLNIDELNFVLSHVDEHVSRVAADADAGHLRPQDNAVQLFSRHEVVDEYLHVGRDGD